jgi:hypothetical protein
MTREYAGLAALDLAFLLSGLSLLAGLGLVRSPRDALRLAGVAFTLGWAAWGILFVVALVAGLPLARAEIALLFGVLALPGVVALVRARPVRLERVAPPRLGGQWLAVASAGVIVLYGEALGRRAFGAAATYHGDAWGFWLPKAKSIALLGGLETGPGGVTSFFHPEYPPLVPALQAAAFRFMDGIEVSVLPVQEWLFVVGFVAAVGGLLATRVPPSVLLPSLAVLMLMPAFGRHTGLSLADQPLAMLFALAGVAVALWLLDRREAYAVLAALLLAGAVLTKKEGLLLALVLAAMAALVSVGRLRSAWRGLVALVVVPLLAVLPWRLWVRAHDVVSAPDYRLSDLLDTQLLADRADRLEAAIRQLPGIVLDPGRWLLAVPLALAAAALAAPVAPRLVVLVVGTTGALFAGLVVVYWISALPPEHYIDTSAERALSSLVLFAAATFPLLLALALEPDP